MSPRVPQTQLLVSGKAWSLAVARGKVVGWVGRTGRWIGPISWRGAGGKQWVKLVERGMCWLVLYKVSRSLGLRAREIICVACRLGWVGQRWTLHQTVGKLPKYDATAPSVDPCLAVPAALHF